MISPFGLALRNHPGSGPFPGPNGPFRPFPFAFRPVCEMAAATLRMVSRLLGLGQEVAKRIRFD